MPSRSWPGGVISPLLANLYLHWFDKVFKGPDGPAQWANARLVRYADDFVALARYQGEKLTGFIESKHRGYNRDYARAYERVRTQRLALSAAGRIVKA
jgi:RNA-directed DNA polymerase